MVAPEGSQSPMRKNMYFLLGDNLAPIGVKIFIMVHIGPVLGAVPPEDPQNLKLWPFKDQIFRKR